MNNRGIRLALVALVLISWTEPYTKADVTIIDLGTLGGRTAEAVAINNSGQVVGVSSVTGDGETHSFLWTAAGGMVDLGTLGGSFGAPLSINNNGQVIGQSSLPGNNATHGFSWTEAGGMIDIGTLGGRSAFPFAQNDSGQVVGQSTLVGDVATHAFLWTAAGGMVDLGTLGGTTSMAFAINNNGQVVGRSQLAGDTAAHAFLWTAADGMIDLGTLGGTNSAAFAINNRGQVAGGSGLAGTTLSNGFLWSAQGGMIDLGTLGGNSTIPVAVNDSGQVVGQSVLAGDPASHAFSWTATGGMIDLDRTILSVPLTTASSSNPFALNNSGQVVGYTNYLPIRALSWTAAGGLIDLGTLGGTQTVAHGVNDGGLVVGGGLIAGNLARHAVLWRTSNSGNCTFSLSAASEGFGEQGGLGSFMVTTGPACGWSAVSNATWISLLPGSTCTTTGDVVTCPTGSRTVNFTVASNSGGTRSGTISIGGQTFRVDQSGLNCTFSIGPAVASFDDIATDFRVSVAGHEGCQWNAVSNVSWITVTSGSSGTGSGSVRIHVQENTGAERSGTVTIAGLAFSAKQGGGACGALDVSSQVGVYSTGFDWTWLSQYEFVQKLQLINSGPLVRGPVYLAFVGVPNWRGYPDIVSMGGVSSPFGATLFQAPLIHVIPYSSCFSSPGDALVLVSAGDIQPGQVLVGEAIFETGQSWGVSYRPKVLSGRPSK